MLSQVPEVVSSRHINTLPITTTTTPLFYRQSANYYDINHYTFAMSIPYPSPSRSPAPPSSYDYPPTSSPSRQGQQRQRSSTSESIPVISYPFKQEARDRRGSNTSEMEEKGYHYVKQSRQLSSGSQSIERMMDGYEGDGIGMERNGSQDGYQTTGVGYGYAIPQHQANYSSTAALTPLPSYQTSPQPQASGSSTPNTTPSKPSKSRQWLGAKSEKLDITELDEEEKEMLQKGLVDWDELKSWRFWFRREWLCEWPCSSLDLS